MAYPVLQPSSSSNISLYIGDATERGCIKHGIMNSVMLEKSSALTRRAVSAGISFFFHAALHVSQAHYKVLKKIAL
jgi:hypothetical protein